MKNSTFFVSIILLSVVSISYAQLSPIYKPFTKLYTIRTEKFDIIFPIESRRTAVELSKIADDIYNKHSKMFNSTVRGRIPVSITPHVNMFNGFFSPVPYSTIVLFDSPMDSDFTTHNDNLEGLFLHELMHALSLASENSGPQTKVFGNWFATTQLNNLGFTLEGVTVSYESLSGFGRGNDPAIKEIIRQDIFENKFKSPIQATGVWGHLDGGAVIYNYGGLFAKYLQDKYGIEKYNAWWFKMARSLYISLILDNHGTYKAFEKVYGIKFSVAWNDFKKYMELGNIETNDLRITKKDTIINDVASFGDLVYYLDNDSALLKSYNTKTQKIETITRIDKSSEYISISKDGKKAIISGVRIDSGLYKYIAREYDFKKKRYTKTWDNVRYATFFKHGIIAIDKDLKNTTLVYINSKNEKELILPPNDKYSYYSPNNIDDNLIALIVVEEGIKSLRILDYNKKTLSKINTTLSNDANIWRYIQYLNYADNKLTFAYNDNDRFYKLGVIDLLAKKAMFYTNDYSGGVYNSVASGSDYFYSSRFSTHYALMKYPNNTKPIISETKESQIINISNIENVALAFENDTNNNNIKTYNYNQVKSLNPFKTWFVVPMINTNYKYFVNGIGIFSIMASPTLDNFAVIYMGYDIPSKFFQSEIHFKSYSLLYPIDFIFYDTISYSYASGRKYWILGATLSQTFRFDLGVDISGMYFAPFINFQLYSKKYDIEDTSSAFTYRYNTYRLNLGTTLKLIYKNQTMKYYKMDLAFISISPQYSFTKSSYFIESEIKLQSRYIPLRFRFYGSYSPIGVFYDGSEYFLTSVSKGDSAFDYRVREQGYSSTWIAGEDIELFHAIDIDKNLSHLYFNNIFLSLIYKGTFYDKEYMHSIGAKVGMRVGVPIFGPFPVIAGEPFIGISFKLPNSINKLYGETTFRDITHLTFGFSFTF